VLTVGSVADFGVDHGGRWLAYTVERRETHRQRRARARPHERHRARARLEKALYRRLAWSDTLPQLAVLRGVVDSAASDTAYAVLGFRGFGSGPRDDDDGAGRARRRAGRDARLARPRAALDGAGRRSAVRAAREVAPAPRTSPTTRSPT
jgi:hypothetical protein